MEEDIFDFPCSATFRHFYAEEQYGRPRIDYEPASGGEPGEVDYQLSARLDAQERRINQLYALLAMRQVERTKTQAKPQAWRPADGLAKRNR